MNKTARCPDRVYHHQVLNCTIKSGGRLLLLLSLFTLLFFFPPRLHCLSVSRSDLCRQAASSTSIIISIIIIIIISRSGSGLYTMSQNRTALITDCNFVMLTDHQHFFTAGKLIQYFQPHPKHVGSLHRKLKVRICRKLHCVPIKSGH